jgi:hypothetical protein
MADEAKNVTDEAKSFSRDIVNSLGLVELILGAVGFYGLWLSQKDGISKIFPSTGVIVVDVVLQLFVAALIGKIICLLVALPMAVVEMVIEGKPTKNYHTALKEALRPYYNNVDNQSDLIDIGFKHIAQADAAQGAQLERQNTKIIVAFGTFFLSLIYLYHLKNTDLYWVILIAAIVFFILGIAEQFSLVKEITQSLITLRVVEERKKELLPPKG